MILNNYKAQRSGFTIVELLIVVVVIAILAAITIVSYNGITQQASNSTALANATNVIKKAEIYASDSSNSGYPNNLAALTNSANQAEAFYLPSSAVTFVAAAITASNPASRTTSDINFLRCGTGATTAQPANLAAITAVTGLQIGYWSYTTNARVLLNAGVTSGDYNGSTVGCYITPTASEA